MPRTGQGVGSFALLHALLALAVAGCGGPMVAPQPSMDCHPVTGKVIGADGQPLKSGTVTLSTTDTSFSGKGMIQTDGTFSITTYFTNPLKECQGAPAVGYMVAVRIDDASLPLRLKTNSVKIEPKDNYLTLEVRP